MQQTLIKVYRSSSWSWAWPSSAIACFRIGGPKRQFWKFVFDFLHVISIWENKIFVYDIISTYGYFLHLRIFRPKNVQHWKWAFFLTIPKASLGMQEKNWHHFWNWPNFDEGLDFWVTFAGNGEGSTHQNIKIKF